MERRLDLLALAAEELFNVIRIHVESPSTTCDRMSAIKVVYRYLDAVSIGAENRTVDSVVKFLRNNGEERASDMVADNLRRPPHG